MVYKIIGKVLQIGAPQSILSKSGNQFMKRDIVIMVRRFDPYTGEPSFDEQNTPKFSFMNEKCSQLDQIKIGEVVTISFDVRGRAYTKEGKTEYLNDLNPFTIVAEKPNFQPQIQAYQQAYGQPQPTYQQSSGTQAPQGYPQPPQQPYYDQPNNTSPYGQNVPQMPQNGQQTKEGDLPF